MCRFLLVQSKEKINPQALLSQFAKMAEKSKTLDGDWQGDGWGIAWLDSKNNWQEYRSLHPVWKDQDVFQQFLPTKTFVVHARSASFPNQKGIIEFNQPFIAGGYAFVFNGLLKGVSLPNMPGKIGAQKIWYLLQRKLQNNTPEVALEKVKATLIHNTREIRVLNMGLVTSENIYSLNYFTQNPEYYQLHGWKSNSIKITCSEELDWTALK